MEDTRKFILIALIGITLFISWFMFLTLNYKSSSYESYEQHKEETIEKPTKTKVGKFEIHTIKTNGHSYLFFDMRQRTGMGGVIHDPDCPCHSKN